MEDHTSRIDSIRELLEEGDEQAIANYALSVQKAVYVDVDLSFGGPNERVRYFLDSYGDITRIDFMYSWWSAWEVTTYYDGPEFDTLAEYFSLEFAWQIEIEA